MELQTRPDQRMIRTIRRILRDNIKLAGIKSSAMLSQYFFKSTHPEWPHLLFIAGLPKSGTTWLAQLLEELHPYKPAFIYDPDDCNLDHNICNDIFAHLPSNMYYVMKLHTHYSPANMKVLDQFEIKPVVMYRDLRDQCVSRYFHVLNDVKHRHHDQYNSTPKDQAMSHNIDLTIEYYLPWVDNWRSIISEQPNRFYEVKYETLRANPVTTLSGVLDFFGITLSQDKVESIVQTVASRTKFDIKENLSTRAGTARKGIIGDWRNHFNEDHVKLFKEKCGQHLINLGYEKDLNWSLEK
jgi:hypothetical protein